MSAPSARGMCKSKEYRLNEFEMVDPSQAAPWTRWVPRALKTIVLASSIACVLIACAPLSKGISGKKEETMWLPFVVIGHYGRGKGIPSLSLNGEDGMGNSGWGGGGSPLCCVLVPRRPDKPVMVAVRWETYRGEFIGEDRWHEATVPIHFLVPPGEGANLKVHFLPGHKVEIWYTRDGPGALLIVARNTPQDLGPNMCPCLARILLLGNLP